jgi:anti-sigma-K factor RskA
MFTNHQTIRDLLPGYALGALDSDEMQTVASHLRTCTECQQALNDYELIESGLLEATPPIALPAHLRASLQNRLTAARSPQPAPQPGFSLSTILRGLVTLAILLLIALNLATYGQLRGVQDQLNTQAQQLQASQTAFVLVSQPGGRTVQVSGQGGAGSFITNASHNTGVLFAQGLSEIKSSQTYQIWLIDSNGKPVSAGLFQLQPGQTYAVIVVVSTQPISDFSGLGVTIEPQGGVPEPTGPLVLGANF